MNTEELKQIQKRETEMAKSASLDPAYNAFYRYQHISFPALFKRLGSRIVEKMRFEGFHAVNRYLKDSYALDPDDYHATLHEYETHRKAIVHVHFPAIDQKVKTDHRPTLCYNIYMCFDLENEDNNIMYYPEISSGLLGSKFILCGYDSNKKRFNLGMRNSEGKMITEDLSLRDIEERFIDMPS